MRESARSAGKPRKGILRRQLRGTLTAKTLPRTVHLRTEIHQRDNLPSGPMVHTMRPSKQLAPCLSPRNPICGTREYSGYSKIRMTRHFNLTSPWRPVWMACTETCQIPLDPRCLFLTYVPYKRCIMQMETLDRHPQCFNRRDSVQAIMVAHIH